jgi:hypothetical protein
MLSSVTLPNSSEPREEDPLNSAMHSSSHPNHLSGSSREDFSEYVAHLQLHMALQARNLVPPLNQTADSRQALLQQTQADVEKLISRQGF